VPEVIDIRTAGDEGDGEEVEHEPALARRVVLAAVAAVVVVFGLAYLLWGGGQSATESTPDGEGPVVAVASGAFEAWGRFGVSGRLDDVAPYFDPDGPQFARFRQEAPAIAANPAGPPPYRFAMSDPSVERRGDGWVVRGPVVVSRPGEADQHYEWELVIRQSDGGWAVWTVRESGREPAGAVGGRR
jgi:hypothetical protein